MFVRGSMIAASVLFGAPALSCKPIEPGADPVITVGTAAERLYPESPGGDQQWWELGERLRLQAASGTPSAETHAAVTADNIHRG